MKVKDLINRLSELDPELPILFRLDYNKDALFSIIDTVQTTKPEICTKIGIDVVVLSDGNLDDLLD